MILQKRDETFESNINSNVNFSIKASRHAFRVLSDGLYSDKITAIIRELSCNAYDSHVDAGKTHIPFKVSLPSEYDNYFSIRDYGTGLSDENMYKIYTTYFESTKQESNDSIGALGLGSKSPFCYTDTFVVKSYFNKLVSTFSVFISDEGFPSISMLSKEITNEDNGLEIIIEVQEKDNSEFKQKAFNILKNFDVLPENNSDLFINYSKADSIIFDDFYIDNISRYSGYVIMAKQGFIIYPINIGELKIDMNKYPMISATCVLNFNIGELEFTASRESISYTQYSVKNIINKLEKYNKVVRHKLDELFAITDETLEAKISRLKNDRFFRIVKSIPKSYLYNSKSIKHSEIQNAHIPSHFINSHGMLDKTYGRSKYSFKERSYIGDFGIGSKVLVINTKDKITHIKKYLMDNYPIINRYFMMYDYEAKKLIDEKIIDKNKIVYTADMDFSEYRVVKATEKSTYRRVDIDKDGNLTNSSVKNKLDKKIYYINLTDLKKIKDLDACFWTFIKSELALDSFIILNKTELKTISKDVNVLSLWSYLDANIDIIKSYFIECKKLLYSGNNLLLDIIKTAENIEITNRYKYSVNVHSDIGILRGFIHIDSNIFDNIETLEDIASDRYPLLGFINVPYYNKESQRIIFNELLLYIEAKNIQINQIKESHGK